MNKKLITTALLIAIIAIMTFVPFLGMIPLGPVSATIIHIPVIIGAVLLGPVYGIVLGLAFGIMSMLKAIISPQTILDPLFINPLVSVLPRIFVGLVASLFYFPLKKYKDRGISIMSAGTSAALATMTNTVLVLTALLVFRIGFITEKSSAIFGEKILSSQIPSKMAIIFAPYLLAEMVVAIIITVPIVLALKKTIKTFNNF